MDSGPSAGGFWAYYREYTRTAGHAAATAALTILGILTFVDPAFAAAAAAAYVLPPAYLYLIAGRRASGGTDSAASGDDRADPPPGAAGGRTTRRAADEGDRTRASDGSVRPDRRWRAVDAPTDETLTAAAATGDRAYAVGDGGSLLVRDGTGWTAAFERGPAGRGAGLRGVDAADDGGAVWVAGDGGAVGVYDPASGGRVDRSAPNGTTSAWEDVAVAGPAGSETVLLVDGSGAALRGWNDGGRMRWGERRKPGSGSSFSAAAFADGIGYLCDTNGSVFRTAGDGYDRVGIDGADGALVDVAPGVNPESAWVAAADGAAFRREDGVWTRFRASDGGLRGIAVGPGGEAYACGDAGVVRWEAGDWSAESTPTDAPLRAVAVGSDAPPVAVGDEGTVLERRAD